MRDCEMVGTPIESKLKVDKGQNVKKQLPYQQLIGSFMLVMRFN